MILDNEQQRQILLQLIDAAQFPGSARKIVNDLAEAIEAAKVENKDKPNGLAFGKESRGTAKANRRGGPAAVEGL